MTTILLTGSNGYIGSHVLNKLLDLDKANTIISPVRAPKPSTLSNNPKIKSKIGNLNDNDFLKSLFLEEKIDFLVHCAWYAKHQDFYQSPYNISSLEMTIGLWKSMIAHQGQKAIFLGSGIEHEYKNNQHHSLYAQSKYLTEQLIRLYKPAQAETDYLWGRIYTAFGMGEDRNRFIPYVVGEYLKGNTPVIQSPYATFEWTPVEYLAQQIVESMFDSREGNGVFYSGQALTLENMALLIWSNFFKDHPKPIINDSSTNYRYYATQPDEQQFGQAIDNLQFEKAIETYVLALKAQLKS
jgi:nucleoside-diphosphate-sugar epimerase